MQTQLFINGEFISGQGADQAVGKAFSDTILTICCRCYRTPWYFRGFRCQVSGGWEQMTDDRGQMTEPGSRQPSCETT